MKPTESQFKRLSNKKRSGDDEGYHSVFDDLLEERLRELDPEWIEEMLKEYDKSEMSRWCA